MHRSYYVRTGNGHWGIEIARRWFIGLYYYGWPAVSEFSVSFCRRGQIHRELFRLILNKQAQSAQKEKGS